MWFKWNIYRPCDDLSLTYIYSQGEEKKENHRSLEKERYKNIADMSMNPSQRANKGKKTCTSIKRSYIYTLSDVCVNRITEKFSIYRKEHS